MSAPMCSHPETERAARDQWAAHYATPAGFRYMPAEELVRFCGRHNGTLGRVVEVGCGNGANLWFLAEHATEVIGLDFCPLALERAYGLCRERRSPLPHLIQASITEALPFPRESVDTVVDCMVSQHLPWGHHFRLYHDYHRVLKPGGRLFLLHLVQGTSTGCPPDRSKWAYNHEEGIPLFPEAGYMCLPPLAALTATVWSQSFTGVEQRELIRVYPDGQRAHYAIIEGTRL